MTTRTPGCENTARPTRPPCGRWKTALPACVATSSWSPTAQPTSCSYFDSLSGCLRPISLPSISPQPYTRLAHEGFQFAKKAGKALEYNARVFHAFFQEDRDIGDPAVLTELAGEIGLDESLFGAALASGEFAEPHKQSLQKAIKFGVNSVPSVFIDGKLLQSVYDSKALRLLLANLEAGEEAPSKPNNALESYSRAPENTP